MTRLADALLYTHYAFLLAMATAPAWAPWQAIAAVGGVVLLMNSLNGMRCPLTQYEYLLRRRVYRTTTISVTHPEWYKRGDHICLSVDGEKDKGFDGRYYVNAIEPHGLVISRYLPSESAMRRLFALCGVSVSEATVARVFAWSLVVLPLAAWVRSLLW
jgi:hypothetical protein